MIVDISNKPETLRSASAQACLQMPEAAAALVRAGEVSKGDVATAARLAAMMAVKRTWELLPHCHPLQLEGCTVEVALEGQVLQITVNVACIGATGVEMEALTGASIAGLTAYDMLKPHCDQSELVLGEIRLLAKTGGKSDFRRRLQSPRSAHIIAVGDPTRHRDSLTHHAQELQALLGEAGFDPVSVQQVKAQAAELNDALQACAADLLITLGGSGHRATDCAPDCLRQRIVRELPGLMEAARQHGQRRSPLAAVSRGVAGYAESGQLLLCLPGSREGWRQSWAAVQTAVVHLLNRRT